MIPLLLLGNKLSERTIFFIKAANELSINVRFVQFPEMENFQEWNHLGLKSSAIKIDPLELNSIYIDELDAFSRQYLFLLEKLNSVPGVVFLNSPTEIARTLDKLQCKKMLENAGISTPRLITSVSSVAELRRIMDENRLRSVFIKPRFGSGAAGIIAYRRNLRTDAEVIYTSVKIVAGRLCNTRKLRCIHERCELETIIDRILVMGALVEEWIPKDSIGGRTYDIRVVRQFGKIEYAVARFSKWPITNLHLGGNAVNLNKISLDKQTQNEIEKLCNNAMSLFPGLHSAGIDVLLEANTFKPYIIEINGQGDLLYKDIHGENKIYKNQLLYLNQL